MLAITATEARLFLREPVTWLLAVLLPTVVLLVVGTLFGPPEPDPELGGQRYIDLFVPSMVVLTLAVLGLNTLPARIGMYRERGVLRRLSTTPVGPSRLLVAQLAINVAVVVVSLVLLLIVGKLAYDVPLPRDPLGFVLAFLAGMSALFALGMVVAAVAPTSGTATAMVMPLFVAVMFLGGVYLPRWLLPDVLVDLGQFVPPGVQGIQDAWLGAPLQLTPVAILLLITVVAGATAARLFRWE
jgi:ABC-2 type transport system permease protein